MNKKVKILIISKQLDIKPNRSVYLNLAKKGYSIDILVPNKKVVLSNNEKNFINIVNLKSLGSHPRVFFIPNLFLHIKEKKYNHIFIENDISSIICLQVCFSKLFFKNILISVFTLENINKNYLSLAYREKNKFNFKKAFIYLCLHFIENFNKNLISKIFVFNNESLKIHIRKFSNSKIIKIPLGIDHVLFTTNKIKNSSDSLKKKKQIVIGIFGRIDKNRGSDLIFKLLLKMKQKINFHIILDCFEKYKNNYTRNLIKKFKLNFFNQINLINPTHNDIHEYISKSDLIMIPSISTSKIKEQYGRLIVEAKLSKTMIIVSDVGAFPETIQNKNLIFKPNLNSLEKKFNRILNFSRHEKNKLIYINYKHSLRFQTSIVQAEKIHEAIK